MKGTMKYIMYIGVMLFTLCLCGCSNETTDNSPKGDGALLNMYVSTETITRLAELGEVNNMFKEEREKENVGLYIYYESDYKDGKGDLSKPYIRNLECQLIDGKLTPVDKNPIYIYDRMTIVAFYPYNKDAINFTVQNDEKAYPITESDYSKQLYIPYRAQANVNPTNAYMIDLRFKPQQTCKIEVVLVANSKEDFPTGTSEDPDYQTNGNIKLVPGIDKYPNSYLEREDLRENWVDAIKDFPEGGSEPSGGKYVRRYTAYVWKNKSASDPHHDQYTHSDNIIKKGDVIFESDKLILTASNQVNLTEETVYRYGYNLETGEIFIPTSDRLVYDAQSLQDVKFNEYRAYQVCDVDLSGYAWTPKTAFKGIYDGGGHKIKNLTTNTTTSANEPAVGLFSNITSESTLMNIDLVNPNITVTCSDNPKVMSYIGALCGAVNPELTEAQKRNIILEGLPDELSPAVKEALVQDGLKNFGNMTCYIRGCKVTNPIITVTGENAYVGGLCDNAGDQNQIAKIKDSYVWQDATDDSYTDIAVNADETDRDIYTAASAGSFCGTLVNGSIANCYSTMEKVHACIKVEDTEDEGDDDDEGEDERPTWEDVAQGFLGRKTGGAVSGCYTLKEDADTGVMSFNDSWPENWPLFKDDDKRTNQGDTGYESESYPVYKWEDSWYDMGDGNSNYPTLVWEHPLTIEL